MQRSHSKHHINFPASSKPLFGGDSTKYSNDTKTDLSSYKQNTDVYVGVTETSITEFPLPLGGSSSPMSLSPVFIAARTVKQ